jgi:hypothetical protein
MLDEHPLSTRLKQRVQEATSFLWSGHRAEYTEGGDRINRGGGNAMVVKNFNVLNTTC